MEPRCLAVRSFLTSRMSCSRPVASLFRMRSSLDYDSSLNLAIDRSLDAVLPGLVKCDAVNLLQNIDSCRGLADLEGRAIHEVRRS